MKLRKAKARKKTAKTAAAAQARIFDRAQKRVSADARREAESKRREWQKLFPKRKPVKRDLSQIKFVSQHWWKERHRAKCTRAGLPEDDAKAAIIYEATRRRSEVQQAWLNGQSDFGPNGWQPFVRVVIRNLPRCWVELDKETQEWLVAETHRHLFLPPVGYSTFPHKPPEKRERASWKELTPPKINKSNANLFLTHLQNFEQEGFIIVAIDNKTNQSVKSALAALRKELKRRLRSSRQTDIGRELLYHLPKGVSDAEREAVNEKVRQRTLTKQHICALWDKYPSSPFASWDTIAESRRYPKKRKRGKALISLKRFDYKKLFVELEDLDNGKIPQSEFVTDQRLAYPLPP